MILYEDNVAQIKSIQNDVISASILQSDDVVELPRSQCIPLNAKIIYNKIRAITHIKELPLKISYGDSSTLSYPRDFASI